MIGRLLGVALAGQLLAASAFAGTLDEVKTRGALRCGVTEVGSVLSSLNAQGRWEGFYTDFCRALAAAATGDAENVEFVLVSVVDRFEALKSGAIDVLSEVTTWTLGRDADGLNFVGSYFIDGQGFLVNRQAGIKTAAELRGRAVCTTSQTTSHDNLVDFDTARGLKMRVMVFSTIEGAYSAFFSRQCEALSTDALVLASMRAVMAPNPADYVLLDERISREPLAATLREGDGRWEDAVRWTMYAMIAAEELGITSANADDLRARGSAEARRLLGSEGDFGAALGLDRDWAYRAIKQVGNYAEMYDRTIGKGLALPRGVNALLRDGGALWAPPFR